MGNFFKSLFSSSKAATPEEEKSKNDQKNFDILKYDGVRAQKIGQVAYAIKCFTEALKLQEDFETMTYLVAAYTTANKAEEALEVLNRMDDTFLQNVTAKGRHMREEIEKILEGHVDTLAQLLAREKFEISGETYIPSMVIEEYNKEHLTDFEEKDMDFYLL